MRFFVLLLLFSCSSSIQDQYEKSDRCNQRYQSTQTGVSNNFENKNLENTRLTNMNLSYACYINANLKNAVFSYSDLSSARFEDADLKGAIFECTNLTNADLSKARNLTQAQLDKAYGEYVRLPNGFTINSNKGAVGCKDNPYGNQIQIQYIDEAQ